MTPIGSYTLELNGIGTGGATVWALSSVPPPPWSAESLAPYILPYVVSGFALDAASLVYTLDPWLTYSGVVTFAHPPGAGPLTLAGIALIGLTDPPVLCCAPVAVGPVTTDAPGTLIEVPFSRVILATDNLE